MKFYTFAIAILVAVLGAAAVVFSEPSTVAPSSSGADDSSMKAFRVE